ncbi:hypothetical protein [Rhizobium leguminosarum]|jgi:hypothetical protein|uniref:hypothetical protein n=1 Tax=Rhizobium TaxID=379 RepID=UPI0010325FD1|nr:hypothetical protein [Rhizobium leguminosarum]TBG01345.1 hypothetical protein ELG85_22580 [Rhizobium leguminosarum]TBG60893.1 hypothetical protein ELG71_22175 [Rhizobium leguminosarum]
MENRNDDDAYAFIPATIKLTPYDRRLRELRSLREKRELAISSNDHRRMAELDYQIKKAEERLEEEKRRDADEKWRRLRDIDDWRSRNGRASRNAGRRKVRNKPNEDLSHMTPAQKEERKRDQRADANFIKRQEAKGVAASDIQVWLMLRQQERDRKRGAAAEAECGMASNPTFGMF